MKKIIFLYHVKEREYDILCMLEQQICQMNPNVQIRKEEFYSSFKTVIDFMPHVIVTIPPRDESSAGYLHALKIITGAVIISMTTEGYHKFDEYTVKAVIGTNLYTERLVDYYIMWGPKTSSILGKKLFEMGKVSDCRRIKTAGYALYEKEHTQKYFSKDVKAIQILSWLKNYEKKVLVLTAFLHADISAKDEFVMGYFKETRNYNKISQEDLAFGERLIREEREFRRKYIDDIILAAQKAPDTAFVIKMHPIELSEKKNPYKDASKLKNVYVIETPVALGSIIEQFDLMIHYNSTSSMEAYIHKIPTVQRFDETKNDIPFLAWNRKGNATYYYDINESEKFVDFIFDAPCFKRSMETEKTLFELFNWKANREYRPVEKIAGIVLRARNAQRLKCSDGKVRDAVKGEYVKHIVQLLGDMMLEDLTKNKYVKFVLHGMSFIRLYGFMKVCKLYDAK